MPLKPRQQTISKAYELDRNLQFLVHKKPTFKKKASPQELRLDKVYNRVELFVDFCTIQNGETLLSFVNKYGPFEEAERSLFSKQSVIAFDYYLERAALLRWLFYLIYAIETKNFKVIDKWVRQREQSQLTVEDALDRPDPFFTPSKPRKKRMVACPLRDAKPEGFEKREDYSDWKIGQKHLQKTKWSLVDSWDKKSLLVVHREKMDFARSYCAFQLNHLVRNNFLQTDAKGLVQRTPPSMFDALALVLFEQFTGNLNLGFCLNENCEHRVFNKLRGNQKATKKSKKIPQRKRKPRSDFRFCTDRCRKSSTRHDGPVRKSMKTKSVE